MTVEVRPGQLQGFPEQPSLLPSPELPKEKLFPQTEIRFKRLRSKLISMPEFIKALRSSSPRNGSLSGNFEFDVKFEGKNYKNKVTLENKMEKQLRWERSFDLSFIGPTITEVAEVHVSQENPLSFYSYDINDEPSASIRERNTQKALTKIDIFILI